MGGLPAYPINYPTTRFPNHPIDGPSYLHKITSLQISNGKVGTGAEATAGKTVSVHYTGWLDDPKTADHKGKKFDSSKDHGDPFEFKLGARQVIAGWDQGVAGMKVGGTRTLVIPSELGYGARGAGGAFPPNATLLFDVELLGRQVISIGLSG